MNIRTDLSAVGFVKTGIRLRAFLVHGGSFGLGDGIWFLFVLGLCWISTFGFLFSSFSTLSLPHHSKYIDFVV